jgi:hypothetical protein
MEIYNNNIYNMGHAVAYVTAGANACTGDCLLLHDNHIHDAANWSASGCPFHQDGLHTFGTSGSSINNILVYGNLFDGDWGTCPTGFVFVEGGSSTTPSHLHSSSWWNNVAVVTNSTENTNGWIGIFSGESGTQTFVNNTVVGRNATDNTVCVSLQGLSSVRFENNTISPCGDPIEILSSTMAVLDYNFYGPSCSNGSNCFVWNGKFEGSFAQWKVATGAEAHSIQSNNPLLNADGSPQTGSPVLGLGINLSSMATGTMTSLSLDTSKGHTRVPVQRSASGPWATGAYAGAILLGAPQPPTNVRIIR